MKHTWLVLAFLIEALPALAQPAISRVSGTLAEGQSVTLEGTNFGSKDAAAPDVFETFAGAVKNHTGLVNGDEDGAIAYDETTIRRPRRTHSARLDFRKRSKDGYTFAYFAYNDHTASAWYISYWMYLPGTWRWGTTGYGGGDDGLSNIKIVRFMPIGPDYTNVDASLNSYEGFKLRRAYEHQTSNDERVIDFRCRGGVDDFGDWLKRNAWHQFRIEYRENSALDAADGVFRIWVDDCVWIDDTRVVTNATGDSGGYKNKRPWQVGFSDSWGYDGPAATMLGYMADVVIDDSLARVELGNAATYAACTRLEYQPATSWSPSSVAFTMNLGAFADGDRAWIYVRNASGDVNRAGYAVKLASAASQTAPPRADWRGEADAAWTASVALLLAGRRRWRPDRWL